MLLAAVLSALLAIVVSAPGAKDEPKHWALIVAGSNGWYNYRHQADVCHAYQILKRHGIPDERIVVMMYDDLAKNEKNPTPGKIINHPNGSDVYHGVPKDYVGDDVTPENFISILQGDEKKMKNTGSGKVIASGPNDHVFVNFVDHGAPGIVAFPSGELHARTLVNALKKMHMEKKFAQMVLYIEACESGSMFKTLPDNIDVFATTASNGKESSYACYFDKKRGTYLGDVYSVKWMEDSDKEDLNVETLQKQFTIVKKETNTSHVQEFGDLDLGSDKVSAFQGGKKAVSVKYPKVVLDAVPAPDVPLAILHHRLIDAKTVKDEEAVIDEILQVQSHREEITTRVRQIVDAVTLDSEMTRHILGAAGEIENYDCYEAAVHRFSKACYPLGKNDYALRHLYVFINLCKKFSVHKITAAITNTCEPY